MYGGVSYKNKTLHRSGHGFLYCFLNKIDSFEKWLSTMQSFQPVGTEICFSWWHNGLDTVFVL